VSCVSNVVSVSMLFLLFTLVFILSCVLLMRCCQCLSVVHSWLSLLFTLVEGTTQRHWQNRIHKTQDKINTRVNRRDNQERTTQRHWQHRIHKTQDKIITTVNRKDNQEWATQRHWQHRKHRSEVVVSVSVLFLLFSLVFILSCVSDVVSVFVLFILDCPFYLL
jgi:ABC-type transport system involved in cytochrome bd biosynthesis fused ATPase/permease subunit